MKKFKSVFLFIVTLGVFIFLLGASSLLPAGFPKPFLITMGLIGATASLGMIIIEVGRIIRAKNQERHEGHMLILLLLGVFIFTSCSDISYRHDVKLTSGEIKMFYATEEAEKFHGVLDYVITKQDNWSETAKTIYQYHNNGAITLQEDLNYAQGQVLRFIEREMMLKAQEKGAFNQEISYGDRKVTLHVKQDEICFLIPGEGGTTSSECGLEKLSYTGWSRQAIIYCLEEYIPPFK